MTIISITIAIIVQVIVCRLFYGIGYSKREKDMQTDTIVFNVGSEKILAVYKKGAGYEARIYNNKYLDIIKSPNTQ